MSQSNTENYVTPSGDADERGVAYSLLGILQSYAPTGVAQMKCTEAYNQAQADGATGHDLAKAMAGALSDGLHHGNWPWVI